MYFVNLRSRLVRLKVGNPVYHTAQIFLYYLSSDNPGSESLGIMCLFENIVVHFRNAADDICMCNRTTVIIIIM